MLTCRFVEAALRATLWPVDLVRAVVQFVADVRKLTEVFEDSPLDPPLV